MTTVAKTPHLQKRGSLYYFRRRVPAHVRSQIGLTEWVDSLATSDLTTAQRKARARSAETDRLISNAELAQPAPTLDERDAHRIAQEWLVQQVALDERGRRQQGTRHFQAQAAYVRENKENYSVAYARGRVAETNTLALKLLEERGMTSVAEDGLRMLSWELLGARLKLLEIIDQRNLGKWVITPPTGLPEEAAPLTPAVRDQALATTHTVAELVEAYTAHQTTTHGSAWVEKRYGHIFRALEGTLGRRTQLNDITRARGREVAQFIRQIPLHAGKRFPGLTLSEAVIAGAKKGTPTLSETTVATYVSNLAAMMNWAVREGWILSNPLDAPPRRATPTVRRRPFNAAELQTVFDPLHEYKATQAWKFWIPALALYTGARAGEICQLQRGDVVTQGANLSLRISVFDNAGRRVEWKSLKTDASERTIPLHGDLALAGLAHFAQGNPDERLFPTLPEGPNGGFSHALSRWFARHLAAHDLSDPSLVFHSFRHGFKDACLRGGASDSAVRALGGWGKVDVADHYGTGNLTSILREVIKNLDFDGFSIS